MVDKLTNGVELKLVYSDVVIEILNDIWIQERLKKCHKLRADVGGLKVISDIRLVEASLDMYERSKKRILKTRTKKNKRRGQNKHDRLNNRSKSS